MFNSVNKYDIEVALSMQQITDTTTSNVITLDSNAVDIAIEVNALTAIDALNNFRVYVTESDEESGTYTETDAENYTVARDWNMYIDNNTEVDTVYRFGFSKNKGIVKYIKVVLEKTGTVDAALSVLAIKSGIRITTER